jgi:hypothetical protein
MILAGERLPQPGMCPDKLYQLMKKCWDATPANRPSFESILQQLIELRAEQKAQDHNDSASANESKGAYSGSSYSQTPARVELKRNPAYVADITPQIADDGKDSTESSSDEEEEEDEEAQYNYDYVSKNKC